MDLYVTADIRLFVTPAELRQWADQFEREAPDCLVGHDLPTVTCTAAGQSYQRLKLVCPQETVDAIKAERKRSGKS